MSEISRSLADYLTQPDTLNTPLTVTIASDSNRKRIYNSQTFERARHIQTNGFNPEKVRGNLEGREGAAVNWAAWKTQEAAYSPAVEDYGWGCDIALKIRVPRDRILENEHPDFTQAIQMDGKEYLEIEMFRLAREVNFEAGMPNTREDREKFNQRYMFMRKLLDGSFTATWEFGGALLNNQTKQGVGVHLEAEVVFEQGLSKEQIQSAFGYHHRSNLLRDSSTVRLLEQAEGKQIRLKHHVDTGEEYEISYDMLELIVIGGAVPSVFLGEMALLLDTPEDFQEQKVIDDPKEVLERDFADWRVVAPTLIAFTLDQSQKQIETNNLIALYQAPQVDIHTA